MAHANIIGGEMVDDDRTPIRELPFAGRMASKFSDQIRQLASTQYQVPAGWHGIFAHAIRSLKAVDCPKRDGIEISEIAFGAGCMHLAVYYAPTDKVVRAILSCLCKRSGSTCQKCGAGYGAVYRHSSGKTLCPTCHVRADLDKELERWVSKSSASRRYMQQPIIEFDSLPINIQLLIPRGQIKCLRLASGSTEVSYVTPDDVLAHLKALVVMKRYLDQTG